MLKRLYFLLLLVFTFQAHAQRNTSVEVAFVMDLSGSTNGLLNDFRNNFYYVINEVQAMRPVPQLKIAVVAYGRPSFGRQGNYVRVIHDFTYDFDQIQYELIQLKTSIEKGNQYVGDALQMAIRHLNWSKNSNSVKMIYLVGNGMTNTNMAINNEKLAMEAVKANININALYVFTGKKIPKEMLGWKAIAENANGIYSEAAINRGQPNPQLAKDYNYIHELNKKLNTTLFPYTLNGKDKLEMTTAIDRYHSVVGGYSFEDRLYFKTTPYYTSTINEWDLVASSYSQNLNMASIDKTYLPEEFQQNDDQNIKSIVYIKRIERNRAQSEAARILGGATRHKEIHERLVELELDKSNTFTRVVVNSLKDKLLAHGIKSP